MADIFDEKTRSKIMQQIRSKKNASTELRLIAVFQDMHLKGWRRNYPVKGHPDFVFHEFKIAIFVDGCFWHGHDCRNTRPNQNKEYWVEKISSNMRRDAETTKHLEKLGWLVIRIWECELTKTKSHILDIKLISLIKNF